MLPNLQNRKAEEVTSYTEIELRELDGWIGINVFGMKAISRDGPRPTEGTEDDYFVIEWVDISYSLPHYSTDPTAAFQVLEKCAEKDELQSIGICKSGDFWEVFIGGHYHGAIKSPTLSLAIVLFAQQLFGK